MESLDILQRYFGYESFRTSQEAVIRRVAGGEHAMVIMPTGGGKSLCYQIPALMDADHSPRAGGAGGDMSSRFSALSVNRLDKRSSVHVGTPLTLVLSPLIALMKDQVDALRSRGIPATLINSSLSRDERERRYAAVARGEYRLLYVTPERFRKADFVEALAQRFVRLLAVDEAHCISEWGHDFRPDYTRLQEFRQQLGQPTTIALTATATAEVQADIIRQLGLNPDEVQVFHEGIGRPNLSLNVEMVWGDDEKLSQITAVTQKYSTSEESGIVYFTLIRTLERFSERLRQFNVPHVCYHGDLERNQRRRIQDEFMEGRSPLVLATPAFGMGIDKENIRFVIHAEIPGSMEAWYQEIGRAGRDGLPSDCVLLYDESDLLTQMEFLRWSNPDVEFYERVYDLLAHNLEQINAFGLEWVREKLHAKQKHDRRLETVFGMLERYQVIEGPTEPMRLTVLSELPSELKDQQRLAEKLRRDQQKLLALVEFVRHDGDKKEFIENYFGVGGDKKRIV